MIGKLDDNEVVELKTIVHDLLIAPKSTLYVSTSLECETYDPLKKFVTAFMSKYKLKSLHSYGLCIDAPNTTSSLLNKLYSNIATIYVPLTFLNDLTAPKYYTQYISDEKALDITKCCETTLTVHQLMCAKYVVCKIPENVRYRFVTNRTVTPRIVFYLRVESV